MTKVLVVYEKTGMGHLRMANIIQDLLQKVPDVQVDIRAGSELLETSSGELITRMWNYFIRKNWMKAADILINFMIRIFVFPIIEVSETAIFHKKLDQLNPDVLVCTCDGYNKILGTYAAERGKHYCIVLTEFAVFIDLINPHATHICYFDETINAIRGYDFKMTYFSYILNQATTALGKIKYVLKFYNDYIIHGRQNSIFRNIADNITVKNNARVKVIGPLAERKHFIKKGTESIKNRLGISGAAKTVLIASGSIGGKILSKMVRVICREYNQPLNLLVMCGNDKAMPGKMKKLNRLDKPIKIIPFGYVDNFDEFLDCADCIIARPSAGIFIESLLHKVPSIAVGQVTANDRGTLNIIDKYKVGEICNKWVHLAPVIEKVLAKTGIYRENIEKLLNKYPVSYEDKEKVLVDLLLPGRSDYPTIRQTAFTLEEIPREPKEPVERRITKELG